MELSYLWKITTLALADSVNPCAIAMLLLVLVVILMQDPRKKYRVLIGGASFILAIYIGYMVFGFILVNIWKIAAVYLRIASGFIYKAFGILAMIIGALQIKDFFMYKPGCVGTEMPLFMRPKVKRLIQKITSPQAAFIIGLLVTLFLLPCTIGPYIIASGILSELTLIEILPWLLYYNFIFIVPMLIIIGMVYFGISKIEDVEGWKERNIRILHLIAGILMFFVGLSLLMGWL